MQAVWPLPSRDRLQQPNIQHLFCHKKTTFFGHLLCPSSGVIYCTHGKWFISCRLCDHFPAETGWNNQISNIYFVIKNYIFRASSVPIIRSYLLYARQLVRFMQAVWPLPSRDGLEQPVSARKWSHSLAWNVPIAVRTVDNSWWWAQKMPENGEYYDKINVGYLIHLVGCFIRRLKFIIATTKLKVTNRRFLQNMMRSRNPGFETAMDGRMNALIEVQKNGRNKG